MTNELKKAAQNIAKSCGAFSEHSKLIATGPDRLKHVGEAALHATTALFNLACGNFFTESEPAAYEAGVASVTPTERTPYAGTYTVDPAAVAAAMEDDGTYQAHAGNPENLAAEPAPALA